MISEKSVPPDGILIQGPILHLEVHLCSWDLSERFDHSRFNTVILYASLAHHLAVSFVSVPSSPPTPKTTVSTVSLSLGLFLGLLGINLLLIFVVAALVLLFHPLIRGWCGEGLATQGKTESQLVSDTSPN